MAKKIFYYESIDSTNRFLKDLAHQNASEGTFVIAKQQGAGRGRQERTFYSPNGSGLYLSVLYRPTAMEAQSLTMRAAVAAVQAIESVCKVSPGIKWVNDLYLNHRKIAGILAEGITENNKLSAVVLGIGINLWDPDGGFPSDLAQIAGSVYGNKKPDPIIYQALTDALIEHLYPLNDGAEMIECYRHYSIVTGKLVTLSEIGREKSGKVIDFSESGALILEIDDGTHEIIQSGEITLRLQNNEKF